MAKVGRPLKFQNPDELAEQIEAYFAKCDEGEIRQTVTKRGDVVEIKKKRPYTIEGLALFLDVSSETIRNYEKQDEFFGTISRARQRIYDDWLAGGLSDEYNAKIAALCLAANYKPYNIQREVNHRSSTVEDVIKRISGSQSKQIEHDNPDVIEGESVSGNDDE